MSTIEITKVVCDECGQELSGKMLVGRLKKVKADVCISCMDAADRVDASGAIVKAKVKPATPAISERNRFDIGG